MPRADLHAHSSFSHDVPDLPSLSPRALFEKALGHPDPTARLDYFCLTDHDTLAGYEDLVGGLPEADRALVIPAVEHTLLDPGIRFTIHVNLFFIDPDTYADLRARVRTLDELIAFCRDADVLFQYNHPTWWEEEEFRAGLVDFNLVPVIARKFPVLELNAGRTFKANLLTRQMAREQGKVLSANSDSHCGNLGVACNEAPGASARDFLDNVWAGQGTTRASYLTSDGLLEIVHELIDGVLDHEVVQFGEGSLKAGHPLVDAFLLRMLNARFLRRPPAVRQVLRVGLKRASVPLVKRKMAFEAELEAGLAGTALGGYLGW